MIHVCFCFCDKTRRYAKFVGTAMLSIFENTNSEVTIHIIHDNTLTDDNSNKFIYLTYKYRQSLKFYNVEELCADKISEIYKIFPVINKTRYSVAMCYRFFIPSLLSHDIERAIYLDADIIVNLDIKELWEIDLGENILAAVPEEPLGVKTNLKSICNDGYVKPEDYFNSGVLLINLSLMRKEETTILEASRFIAENPYRNLFDQSILNYCFSTRTLKLPIKFNRMTYLNRAEETSIKRKIYHYATVWGLGLDQNDVLNKLWMDYFIKTPWFDTDSIGRLYKNFLKIRNYLKEFTLILATIMHDKRRAFFIEPQNVDSMRKIFLISNQEEIILAENEDSIQKLIETMQTANGMCVFFIMTEKFLGKGFPFDKLKQAGFVEDKDFLRGWRYLSEAKGVRYNSFPLIQAM